MEMVPKLHFMMTECTYDGAHQDNWFPPNRGFVSDIGSGDGEGFAGNIRRPEVVLVPTKALDRIVSPALEGFKPDIIFIACFDGSAFDPLGSMMMHSKGYASLTKKLMAAADRLCNGRLVMAHEGGYSPLKKCPAPSGIEALSESRGVDDPFLEFAQAWQVKICSPIRKNLLQSRNRLATLRALM